MSYQTKEQSMGYILKALLDTEISSSVLKEIYYSLDEAIDDHIKVNGEHESIDNYSTYDFMVFITREHGADDERIKAIGSNLYYGYDMFTVGEAGGFYEAFKVILRIR